jgi:MoaE-MoaD fusion protein
MARIGPMRITVRLFAILRERAGHGAIELELPSGATVSDALSRLRAGWPGLEEPLGAGSVAVAVNREYAGPATQLSQGDELALVPPVSGGADVHARVTDAALDPGEIARSVVRDRAGAVVTFQGVTREVEQLDYEAYREMAEPKIAAILTDCLAAHGLEAAAAQHRTGSVARGESSVVVAVSAAHREQAFAGARDAIDRIKAEAPIWKREVQDGQATWVEGSPAPGANAPGGEPASAKSD